MCRTYFVFAFKHQFKHEKKTKTEIEIESKHLFLLPAVQLTYFRFLDDQRKIYRLHQHEHRIISGESENWTLYAILCVSYVCVRVREEEFSEINAEGIRRGYFIVFAIYVRCVQLFSYYTTNIMTKRGSSHVTTDNVYSLHKLYI